jgi:hypothetical protein
MAIDWASLDPLIKKYTQSYNLSGSLLDTVKNGGSLGADQVRQMGVTDAGSFGGLTPIYKTDPSQWRAGSDPESYDYSQNNMLAAAQQLGIDPTPYLQNGDMNGLYNALMKANQTGDYYLTQDASNLGDQQTRAQTRYHLGDDGTLSAVGNPTTLDKRESSEWNDNLRGAATNMAILAAIAAGGYYANGALGGAATTGTSSAAQAAAGGTLAAEAGGGGVGAESLVGSEMSGGGSLGSAGLGTGTGTTAAATGAASTAPLFTDAADTMANAGATTPGGVGSQVSTGLSNGVQQAATTSLLQRLMNGTLNSSDYSSLAKLLTGAFGDYQTNKTADRLMDLASSWNDSAKRYNGLLEKSYTDPMSYLQGPEYQAAMRVTGDYLQRQDAAKGVLNNDIGRAAKLQDLAFGNLDQYRKTLGGITNNQATVGTGQASVLGNLMSGQVGTGITSALGNVLANTTKAS